MAIAVFNNTDTANTTDRIDIDDRLGWGYALLLATTATLFLRPADILPSLDQWPIYQNLILVCLVVSGRTVLRQLRNGELISIPVTSCLILMLLSIGASHLSHGDIWSARMSMLDFLKPLTFYLLVIGLVNTPRRLFVFAKILVISIATIATLAILDRYGYITIAALESVRDRALSSTTTVTMIDRLRGTGIFQDPNDFGLILVTGCVLSLSFLLRPGAGWRRYAWLAPTSVLLIAFSLTHSRGAMLSLACVIPAVFVYHRGTKVALLSLFLLPFLGMVFSSRMTEMEAIDAGTGQSRIQIWSESLAIWRQYPIFGIGDGMLVDEIHVVSHNSYIHCFAELGFVGGTAFLTSFLSAGLCLWAFRRRANPLDAMQWIRRDQESRNLSHLQVFTFAMLVAYAAGIVTLSRQFVTPTYLVLGFATAAQKVSMGQHDVQATQPWRIGNRLIVTAMATSCSFLIVTYILVRILVRW
ncbi:O-Antigen ligase [Planctomycetes bacterium CA13]|uniref:O-Antigen ligase n=1 Tax=Novipirellula herctigrandis TaxID=2527986 RepID=A0A5C5Z6C3_9BACT|nr:O-Antigen ligase [Planctomycetes bacterium CA13]